MHADNARERRRNVMPGLLPRDMRAETSADHFAMGFVTNDAGGTGTERVQGQHNDFHLWVFEEAEGMCGVPRPDGGFTPWVADAY